MSTANVRRLYECIDGHDIPAMLELFAEDVHYRRPGYQPIVGRAALERFYRTDRVIKDGVHTLDLVFADGENVAVRGRFDGVLKNEERVELQYADLFTVNPDGRFASRETFFFHPLV